MNRACPDCVPQALEVSCAVVPGAAIVAHLQHTSITQVLLPWAKATVKCAVPGTQIGFVSMDGCYAAVKAVCGPYQWQLATCECDKQAAASG